MTDEAVELDDNTVVHHLPSSSLLARNASLNLVTEGWLFLILLFAIPKLVSLLGEASFGLFSIAWVVIGYLAFLDIGVGSATTKFTAEYLARRDKAQIGSLIRTALAANCVMGVVAAGVAVAISPILVRYAFKIPSSLHGQALLVFVGVSGALPALLIQGVLRGALSAYQRFDWINLVNGTCMTLQWGLMTLLAWRREGVVTVVWVAVLARIAMDIVYLFLLLRLVPTVFTPWSFRPERLRQLLHFGAWVSVSQVMGPLLVFLDRMMIAALVSLPAVTIYTIPTEILSRLGIVPSCLVATLFPAFSSHDAIATDRGQLARLYNTTTRYLLLALSPLFVFLVVNAHDVLTAWMGPHFATEGTLVLQVLGVGALLNFLARLPFAVVQASGRPDVTAKFHLLELPIYVALCLALIPKWGVTGAAVACTLRVSLDACLMFWAVSKCSFLKPRWLDEIGRIVAINSLLVACLLSVHRVLGGVWGRLLSGSGLLLLCYLAIWIYALDSEDKPAITRTLRLALQRVS